LKVLLDECVDARFAPHITGFDTQIVLGKGWSGISNGKLLALAQAEFDVFVTVDKNLSFQQHLPKFSIAAIPKAPRGQVTKVDAQQPHAASGSR
jgi:hypothetical protein